MKKKVTTNLVACIAGFAAALSATAGFVHEMPKATNETPLDTPYAEMAETFKDPFGKVQTGCYWYWMAGNVSCEGVRKDLEAIAATKKADLNARSVAAAVKIIAGTARSMGIEVAE